jgi:hypothetical protein
MPKFEKTAHSEHHTQSKLASTTAMLCLVLLLFTLTIRVSATTPELMHEWTTMQYDWPSPDVLFNFTKSEIIKRRY